MFKCGRTWKVAALASLVAALCSVASPTASAPSALTSPLQQPTPSPSPSPSGKVNRERPSLDGIKVPFPGSLSPVEILANIRAVATQTHLADGLGMPELLMRDNELKVRRILQVRSEVISPGWPVVELQNASGGDVANIAITRGGVIIGGEDCRGRQVDRPLDLDDAKARVRGHRGREPLAAEYVYFNNVAERGISYTRPLAAVTTERGTIYLNSKAEAFAEEGSPHIQEFAARARLLQGSPGLVRLYSLGQW